MCLNSRWGFICLACLVWLLASAPFSFSAALQATSISSAPGKRSGRNAVDFYKHAIELYAGLTDAEKEILKHPYDPGKISADEALRLSQQIKPVMDLIRSARKAEYSDWALGHLDFDTGVPHLVKVQDLSKVAYWDAGYRFGSDPDGAVSDLAARDAMGRSVDEMAIGFLVDVAINFSGLRLMVANAAHISAGADDDVAYLTDTSEEAAAFARAMEREAVDEQNFIDRYNNPATRDQVLPLMRRFGAGSERALSKAPQLERALGGTLLQSDAQFNVWWSEIQKQLADSPAVLRQLVDLNSIRTKGRQDLVQRTMAAAGLALLKKDQQRFNALVDPSTGKPFTFTETTNGIQLSSSMLLRDKLLSLTFSAPKP